MSATPPSAPVCVIVMGVTACGKSSVGEQLAARMGWPFLEGDALHPPANIARMRAGQPLDDTDRAPWLAAIGAWIDARIADGESSVVACSALKRGYRDALRAGRPGVRFAWLRVDRAELQRRLRQRAHHFMPASLLASQLDTLEPPQADEPAIVIDAAGSIDDTVDHLQRAVGRVRPQAVTRRRGV
jgi:carbohydrate kinase (thermoresistant glucokinase family)